ncbi:MAG: 2-isopropylmalate synthase [Tannerella sp.]|jgi:D-citramalate synthase|nr:2-isopropylmalate synthase [Tannerella sp.]
MIELLDTTLRDGEQTNRVSFSRHEKKEIARLLLNDLNVDRIEIGSARVSKGEFDAVRKIVQWASQAGCLSRVEVLGFIDGGESLQWIKSAGCRVVNLLCKGSERHLTEQLRKTPEQHIDGIVREIKAAEQMGIAVNIYLEDWSNGIRQSPEYVYRLTDVLAGFPLKRIMLPDTLGVLNPENTYAYCKDMVARYPGVHFDFHAHNDYDLAVANVYAAVRAGIRGIHVTVNGLGERAGNASLSSVVAVIHDQLKMRTSVSENRINQVGKTIEAFSGVHIAPNSPIVGEHVFTQCAGVHADGDSKNNLYCNDLIPERFGRMREYALGKTSGKANIRKNLEMLEIELNEDDMRKVTERVIELGDKKEIVTQDDLPYIISDVLHYDTLDCRIKILNYSLSLAQGLKPVASLKIEIDGKAYEETATGDGQYDAFVRALRKIYKSLGRTFPMLTNYAVSIPPGGRTDAFVQTIISWNYEGTDFKTRGLDADQTEAAIQATLKMLNKIENKPKDEN